MNKELRKIINSKDFTGFVRWGKNGRKYTFLKDNLSYKKMDYLIYKYGVEQICEGWIWLN